MYKLIPHRYKMKTIFLKCLGYLFSPFQRNGPFGPANRQPPIANLGADSYKVIMVNSKQFQKNLEISCSFNVLIVWDCFSIFSKPLYSSII